MPYGDLFEVTWKAFSRYPLQYLSQYQGKKVRNYYLFPLYC